MKRNLLLIFIALLPMVANAYDAKIDGIYYNFSGDKATVTYDDNKSYFGSVVIPSTITYNGKNYLVTSIGSYAFSDCTRLTSITIPESVTSIGDRAFSNCSSLTSIVVESGNTVYDSRNNCNAIIETATNKLTVGCKNTIIPNSVTSISSYAFYYCSGLASITIPNSVTNISSYAFYYCSGLASITIPNSVTNIGSYAFSGCSGLTSVTLNSDAIVSANREYNSYMKLIFGEQVQTYILGDAVKSIGDNAFYGCSGLTSITIPESVTNIGSYAFYGCSGLASITIPNSVTNIGSSAFYGCSSLTSVTIPNSVTTIGDRAFYGCSGLTSVTIPNSVTSISSHAFANCSGLTSITIPNSVTTIGDRAFYGCSGLTSVTIPNSVTSISSSAFSYCSGLASITIPNSVTSISSYAFYGCSSLTSITIPNSVTSIGDYAFYNCSSLTSITIPNSVTTIGNYAFDGCSGLTSVTLNSDAIVSAKRTNKTSMKTIFGDQVQTYILGDAVKRIGDYAFYNCSSLTSITIPNSVTTISSNTFRLCSSLTSITIPNSVTSIGNSAFADCTRLTSITIPNSVTSIGHSAFYNCTSLTSVTIPNSVTSIGERTFSECSSLTSVTIGNSVTSIGSSAFSYCSGLASITIPNSVTSIGDHAFDGCTNLKKTIWLTNTPPSGYTNVNGTINYVSNNQYSGLSNTIVYPFLSSMFEVNGICYVPVNPSERTCDAIDCRHNETVANMNIASTVSYKGITMQVKKMQPYFCYNNQYIQTLYCDYEGIVSEYAFSGCKNLTSAEFNNNGSIGANAFSGCTKLANVECNNNGGIGANAFSGCTKLANVECNNNGGIGSNAFNGCTNLNSLTLGEEVSSIGDYSFQGCSSLQSVTIPDSVSTLGNYAFSGCSSLASVNLGNNIKSLANCVFQNCGILSINIPETVNSINDYAFRGCTKLKTIIIANRENELSLGNNGSSPLFSSCPLDSVYIGGNISYNTSSSYGYSPFYRNTSLRTVVIADKETDISPNEFYGCTNLQNFTIGDGVTSFGDWAFSGCTSLKRLSFGSHLASIGKEAFSDCNSVTQIVSKAVTPPSCGTQALDDINKWECTLTVPEGSLTSYQQAEQWKEFFFINEGNGEEPPVIPDPEKCATPTISYANGELIFNCETEGVEFVSEITDTDIRKFYDAKVSLSATYTITVYATKTGYDNSDVATATLCWIDAEPKTEGLEEDAVTEVKALPVLIQTEGGLITIRGLDAGTEVSAYSTNGMLLDSAVSAQGTAILRTSLTSGSTAIIKIGQKAVKVMVK